ncbi:MULTISPECIES: thiol-disulfide oxidoreductase DCC family protein [unclassified Streptomyces]|uniref:thiol-disulfide oxidoreductase DCC family protein n=1 Tax=unclassified Streptomyces TaxID=2593676 RepID=UPI0036C11C6B
MRTRPVLVFDGDCGFCTACVSFVGQRLRPDCEIVARRFADPAALGVTPERAAHEALWVTPSGQVYGGARAVAKILLRAGRGWAPLGALLMLPPWRWAADAVYRLVADNRHRMPGGTAVCAAPARRGRD